MTVPVTTAPGPAPTPRPNRLGFIDWLRGLAVVLMIETHSYDAWLTPEAKREALHRWIRIFGGAPAPLFLFLAGLALGLVAASRFRRGATPAEVTRNGLRRGLEVIGWAFLFRLWMLVTAAFHEPLNFLRIDVLNCIGVAMVVAAAVALPWRTPALRLGAALALTTATALATPLVWNAPAVLALPAPLRGYLVGGPPLGFFPLFPWAGFTAFGLAVGLVLAGQLAPARDGARIGLLAACGAGLVALGLGLERLPSPYAHDDFWRTSPSFFWIRGGLLLLVVAFAWLWERTPWGRWPSPLRQMGKTSLLVYWVHIEIVYGVVFTFWARHALGLAGATLGWILLAAAMLALSRLRTHGWHGFLGGVRS